MKKGHFLTITLLIFLVMPSFAQSLIKDTGRLYIGVGGNLNSTWISNPNFYGEPRLNNVFTMSPGFNFNIGYDYKHWGLKVEVGFAQLGQKFNGTQYGEPANRTIKFSYILIPALMKYRVGSPIIKFYAMAGAELGIMLAATQVYQRNGVDAPVYNHPEKGDIDVSQHDIGSRNNTLGGAARVDFGIELTPVKHFMIDIGPTGAFFITDLNSSEWRFIDPNTRYRISHNLYAGINLSFNYKF
jgi:hypothetical protein